MSNQELGFRATAVKLATILSGGSSDGRTPRLLNDNAETLAVLLHDPGATKIPVVPDEIKLKVVYGIANNSFSLTIVRLLAFSELKKSGIHFKWFQNPLLKNV